MDYRLLNKLENAIKACCVGKVDGTEPDYDSTPAAESIACEVSRLLEGVEIDDKDWTMLCICIQSWATMAAARAIRIIGASHGVVT